MSRSLDRSGHPLDPGKRATASAQHALEEQACEEGFQRMLDLFLSRDPRQGVTPVLGVLAALANGVMLLSEAASLAETLGKVYRADGSVYAYFEGYGGRQRCVKLNEIALIARQALSGMSFTCADALKSFVDWLDQHDLPPFTSLSSSRIDQLAAIERGAKAFWSRHLPNLLLSDATAELTLRPLRPQALARWITGQPLAAASAVRPGVNASAACALVSAESIESGPVLQQIVDIMSTGEGTPLDALRGRQLQLLEPLVDEVVDDIPGAMLLTAASGICHRGTVDTSTPSHSIGSRYSRELKRMLSAEPALAASSLGMNPLERRAAYEILVKHAKNESDGRAALTTADMHWCDATGAEPVMPLRSSAIDALRGPGRYLSPREIKEVRQLCPKLAPTTDLNVIVRALSAMACSRPLRPGDLLDAKFEDLEISPNRAVLNLRRRRNLKGPKRVGTEGPMEFTDPEVVAELAALKAYRESQAAMDGCPLWGPDVQESRRRYMRACALIDQACKHVSGDPFESFYSLRHGLFTQAIHAALLLDDPAKAQTALKQASLDGKHRHVGTSTQDYFRLGFEHAHRHVRTGVGKLLTRESVATWSGLGKSALDKRISRSDSPTVEVLWHAMAEAAPIDLIRSITDEFPCAPSSNPPAVSPIRLADVLGSAALTQISFEQGRPLPATTAALLTEASGWDRRLLAARGTYEAHWKEVCRLAATRQPKLRPIAARLARFADSAAVREATALWRHTAKKGFIDVSDASRLVAWSRFLLSSGIPASRLVLRVDPSMLPKLEFLSSLFSSVTGLLPTIDEVPGGKDRPAAYLLISSQEPRPRESLPSAATSMAGFNALMLAACLREDLSTESGEVLQ